MRGYGNDVTPRGLEYIFPLLRRCGIVEVENDILCSMQCFKGTNNEIFAALAENLNRHVVGNPVLLDQTSAKIELDLRCGREPYFDFLKSNADEHFKILELFLHAHWLGKRLVSITKINAAPNWSAGYCAVRPLAIWKIDLWKGPVFINRRILHRKKST